MIVRRLDPQRIEVLFGKPYQADGRLGASLLELDASDPEVHVLRDGDNVTGYTGPQKTYLDWLQKMEAPKALVSEVRKALDESKKARRERMRGR